MERMGIKLYSAMEFLLWDINNWEECTRVLENRILADTSRDPERECFILKPTLWQNCKDANNTAHLLFDIFTVSFRLSLVSSWQAANFTSGKCVTRVKIKPHLQVVCKTQWLWKFPLLQNVIPSFSLTFHSRVLFTLHIVINFYCWKHMPGKFFPLTAHGLKRRKWSEVTVSNLYYRIISGRSSVISFMP